MSQDGPAGHSDHRDAGRGRTGRRRHQSKQPRGCSAGAQLLGAPVPCDSARARSAPASLIALALPMPG